MVVTHSPKAPDYDKALRLDIPDLSHVLVDIWRAKTSQTQTAHSRAAVRHALCEYEYCMP